MTASFPAVWLPVGIARKAVLPAAGLRFTAPERDAVLDTAALDTAALDTAALDTVAFDAADAEAADLDPPAEPEWADELFDPARDGDPFEWLGFGPDSD
jgi:hypothetical protein